MSAKSFQDFFGRLQEEAAGLRGKVDMVVAVARGGVVPAALLGEWVEVPVEVLRVNFRDDENVPRGKVPVLLRAVDFEVRGKRILAVDDRAKTGTTLEFVRGVLRGMGAAEVRTLVVNGKADVSLWDEDCFRMPWRGSENQMSEARSQMSETLGGGAGVR